MNNPMGMIFQMMRSGSPHQLIQNMASNNAMMQNPMMKNAINMAQRGDTQGMERLARNLCKQKGIDPDQVAVRIKQQFGMR